MTPQTALALSLDAKIVLARLLIPQKKPCTRSEVRRSLEPLIEQRLSAGEINGWLDRTLADLAGQGLIEIKPLRLTDTGASAALEFLGLEAVPPRFQWKTVKNKFLVPLALGAPGMDGPQRNHVGSAAGLRAMLLKTHFDLPTGQQPSLTQALDAFFTKQLGIGMRKSGVDALRAALLQNWIKPKRDDTPVSFNLAGFAEAVRECAGRCVGGRFGQSKVFINHVWNEMRTQGLFPELDESAFKQRLVEANRAGLVSLSRADLVEAMNPEDVRASEAGYLNAVFHFIQLND